MIEQFIKVFLSAHIILFGFCFFAAFFGTIMEKQVYWYTAFLDNAILLSVITGIEIVFYTTFFICFFVVSYI